MHLDLSKRIFSGAVLTIALYSIALCFGVLNFAMPCTPASAADASWPQWRGGEQNGVAPTAQYPVNWSEGSVKWKTDVAGRGGSTPVVVGDKAFFTSGIDGQNHILGFNIDSGKELWRTPVGSDKGNKHRKGSGSNPSAVTDGDHVFAYFRSGDLACVDLSGDVAWHVNLQDEFGEDTLWWDLGSSPLLMGDLVVVAVMQSGPSYLVAYNRETGKRVWKSDRMLGAPEEAAQSYATPLAIPGKDAIAVMGADHLTIHSAKDGKELGRVAGFNPDQDRYFRSISSPVISGDLIVCPYSRGGTVTVCRISDVIAGKGRDSIVWHRDGIGSDVPTPAVHDGRVYIVGDSGKLRTKGKLWCVDLESGKTVWEMELPKSRHSYSSSPLVAGGNLYVVGEDARTYVIGPLERKQPAILATNDLEDAELFTVASPVPVEGGFLQRTRHSLYRITE